VTRRTERIAGELLSELARLLREEVSDPRVGVVTLTRIDVAPDLTHALVFWSALDVAGDRVAGSPARCRGSAVPSCASATIPRWRSDPGRSR
jgi:hypothetical protein